MGGGRRFFLPADATDPERGSNTAHGRLDGRNLIDVSINIIFCKNLYYIHRYLPKIIEEQIV